MDKQEAYNQATLECLSNPNGTRMNIIFRAMDIYADHVSNTSVEANAASNDGNSTARQWLEDFIKQPFDIKKTENSISYYRDKEWIFQQDLENKIIWCRHVFVWDVLESRFHLNSNEIKLLVRDIVGLALNCKGFTPGKSFELSLDYLDWA